MASRRRRAFQTLTGCPTMSPTKKRVPGSAELRSSADRRADRGRSCTGRADIGRRGVPCWSCCCGAECGRWRSSEPPLLPGASPADGVDGATAAWGPRGVWRCDGGACGEDRRMPTAGRCSCSPGGMPNGRLWGQTRRQAARTSGRASPRSSRGAGACGRNGRSTSCSGLATPNLAFSLLRRHLRVPRSHSSQ